MSRLDLLVLSLALAGCAEAVPEPQSDAGLQPSDGPEDLSFDASTSAEAGLPDVASGPQTPDAGHAFPSRVLARVSLDGEAVAGARVSYGGSGVFVETSSSGEAWVELRPRIEAFDQVVIAAHPEARTEARLIPLAPPAVLEIPLLRFARIDNEAYRFQDPGTPERRPTTQQCAHCHVRMSEAWADSAHRSSALNAMVHDLYSGTASVGQDRRACLEVEGVWSEGPLAGGGRGFRCYLGGGVLRTLNPQCTPPGCEDARDRGDCAACHAPGIDGPLTGRGLLEAEGRAFDYGIHCDVCHRVEAVGLPSDGPGVSGALRLLRPSEQGPLGLGEDGWLPLTFGPSWDSPNPKMGSAPRAFFRGPEFCRGCHQYDQASLVPGTALDPVRWPQGRFPVQSTYEEWRASPYAPGAPCQSCHMPPDADAENGGDLQLLADASQGIAGGWTRPPGSVRSHAFLGPRTESAEMLKMAASLQLEVAAQTEDAVELEVSVTNVGAGHALPTGEPLRQIFLLVEARCATSTLTAIGGEAIGPLGGAEAVQSERGGWPEARVGDRLRAVSVGPPEDYDGTEPFGATGRLSAEEKGRRPRQALGEAVVIAVEGDEVRLDRPLPPADEVYRVRGSVEGPPAWAGQAGTSFARVLTDAEGRRGVPHYAATDVLRDDRLLPRGTRVTRHRFRRSPAGCVVEATARLMWRPFPRWLSLERGWTRADQVMAEVRR